MIDYNQCKSKDLCTIDTLIRSSEFAKAHALLNEILSKIKGTAKSERIFLANLCRRLGMSLRSLKLLHSNVRTFQKNPKQQKISSLEIAEYGGALIQLGSSHEALKLFNLFIRQNVKVPELDSKEFQERYRHAVKTHPDLYFQLAMGKIRSWDYEGALISLNTLCEIESAYWKLVCSVNKAACLVHLKRTKGARPFLLDLIRETQEMQTQRLHNNCLELLAQLEIFDSRPAEAILILQNLKNKHRGPSRENLFCNKWSAFAKALTEPWSVDLQREFDEVRKQATVLGDSETLREIDRMISIKTKDMSLFQKVYFGTTYLTYKNELLEDFKSGFGKDFAPPSTYDINIQKTKSKTVKLTVVSFPEKKEIPKKNSISIDLTKGLVQHWEAQQNGEGKGELTKKSVASRKILSAILETLLKDFYRSPTTLEIFESVYPDQYYNPYTSPNRLNQNILRLRNEIKLAKIPLEIVFSDGTYKIIPIESHEVNIRLGKLAVHPQHFELRKILEHLKEEDFQIQHAVKICKIPRRSLVRKLAIAQKEGLVQAFGKGRARRYRVLEST